MNEILKIECPKCGKKFDAGSAFNAHIKSTKKQQEEIIKKESEKKFKSKLEAKDKEIDKTRKEEAKKAKTEAENKFKSQLEAKDKEIDKTIKSFKDILKKNNANLVDTESWGLRNLAYKIEKNKRKVVDNTLVDFIVNDYKIHQLLCTPLLS